MSLSDGSHTTTYSWDLVVGAPIFSGISSTTVSVEIGSLVHFTFASYSDPENDDVTFTSYLQGGTPLPSFINYSTVNNTVYFAIGPAAAYEIGSYTIECKICDPSPACTTATFVITVTDTPVFAGLASRYDVKLSSPGSFTYSDPAGLPLTVTITPAALTFVTCVNIGTCRLRLTAALPRLCSAAATFRRRSDGIFIASRGIFDTFQGCWGESTVQCQSQSKSLPFR